MIAALIGLFRMPALSAIIAVLSERPALIQTPAKWASGKLTASGGF
jgi:hypothetical protein